MTGIERLSTALEGRYHIERELGEGGMATVYLAEDVKHERKVAIKVLRPELAAVIGAERFVAEIRTTAQLQHPHILPLFDSGEADGFLYYVMPYVEGESLREKLDREKQLGVEEALGITRSVADALDYAHRQGVIHRDIKPANILLHDGRPVVADFGIAVAISAAGGGRLTETGLSLGTPHYMSPEQATADRDLTARSDVYSLGCVLYEMLAGDPPHTASTAQAVLVRILTEPPRPPASVRASVPPHVSAAVMKALEKLPADRFSGAEAFKGALDDPLFRWETRTRAEGAGPRTAAGPVTPISTQRWSTALPWGVAAAAVLALVWIVAAGGTSGAEERVLRLDLSLGDLERPDDEDVVISPDGSMLVVGVETGDERALYLRRLSEATFAKIPGTEGGEKPTFSPYSRWILYRNDGDLVRVAPDGGGGLTVFASDTVDAWNPHWGDDGTIAFTGPHGVFVIPPDGTARRVVGSPGSRPFVLPDGSAILNWTGEGVTLRSLADDSTRLLVPRGAHPRYLASGHLLYVGPGGSLFSRGFDLESLELTGTPVRVLDGVSSAFHRRGYSVAGDGTLVVLAGPSEIAGGGVGATRMLLLDRTGAADTVRLPPGPRYAPSFSPDGRYLAYEFMTGQATESNIHVYDLLTGHEQAITFEGDNEDPVWSPDGTRILFDVESDDGDEELYVKWVDNRAPKERLAELPGRSDERVALSWIEGDVVLFEALSPETGWDLHTLRLGAEGTESEPYLRAPWDERGGGLSPDGTLVAYSSDQTGEPEVWLRTFPDPTGTWRLSLDGGRSPRWDPAGRGVYFWTGISAEPRLMFVPVERDPVRVGTAEEVLSGFQPRAPTDWDVHPDGNRFLVIQDVTAADAEEDESEEQPRYHVVLNWFRELEARMGERR